MAAATPVTSENPSSDPVPDRSAAPLRVGVLGAHGRLGTAIVDAVERADGLLLVARLGRGDAHERALFLDSTDEPLGAPPTAVPTERPA